jgi:ribosome-associated heat shock protein Hsp15
MIRKSGSQFSDETMLHRDRDATTNSIPSAGGMPAVPDRQRIDRWLWHARVVRTRDAAAALAGGGFVRVNGARIDAPGRMVRAGDVITVALDQGVRVLKVTGFVERRGPGGSGADLYESLE